MTFFLARGATLVCSKGGAPSQLAVPSRDGSGELPDGSPIATAQDFGEANILPFGTCKVTQQACKPSVLLPWTSAGDVVDGDGIGWLTQDSKCVCSVGGTIEAADAGQDAIEVA
ncbi:DUF4280 domain-containing protein [Pendulispora brunnea]|uniref:DUF4280 domain-containing protein n=1 Tax=Pendulispora brunnea TaxID=2905690 RepID=A0ABZ2KDN6_9BACT